MIKKIDFPNFFFKKENIIIQHLLFWMLVIMVVIIFKEYPAHLKGVEIVCFIIQFVAFMAVPGYVHNSFVLPVFKRKKIVLGLILFTVELFLLTLMLPYLFKGISLVFIMLFEIKQWIDWENENIEFNIFSFTIMASIINVAKEKFLLQKEQREAELRQLKEQLNPHFLFNTLNNLYGLSVIKSDKLPGLMLKLSDLLRYSLYETNHQLVSLEKELLYIKNYIELEKIRLEERATIEVNISGDFHAYSIAPLMLIVFIENSFKHLSSKRNQLGVFRLDIGIKEGVFEMNLINSVDSVFVEEVKEKKSGGIGLSNVKKRLQLIYGEKHSLSLERLDDYYKVDLKINLK